MDIEKILAQINKDTPLIVWTMVWQTIRDFREAEGAELKTKIKELSAAIPVDKDPEDEVMYEQLNELAKAGIDEIIVPRLVQNRHTFPLLQTADVEYVILYLTDGEQIDKGLLTALALIRPIIANQIKFLLIDLTVINDNPYMAVWELARAIYKIAARVGKLPSEAIKDAGLRAEMFRNFLTWEKWCDSSQQSITQLTKITLTSLLGNTVGLLDADEAEKVTTNLETLEPVYAAFVKDAIAIMQDHHNMRGREIWPQAD